MGKQKKLRDILKKMKRVVIAYSGGRDSTFLLKMSVDTLGKSNVLAVTARSATYPLSEYKEAKAIASRLKAWHIIIRTDELNDKNFKANPVDRCYYCKKELFTNLEDIRRAHAMFHVIDGANVDDLKDIRHGSRAAKELGVRHPLLEAGMTKSDIGRFSRSLKLPTWDKPPYACLASRFPFNNVITELGLGKIEKAEDFLRSLGFRQVRVRLHDSIARIEVSEEDLILGMKHKDLIINRLKKLGFIYIALDLEGYRTGSMHEAAGIDKSIREV